ncbi:MAG: 4-alpha-glucanotransferase [Chloroflexota bacterium]|nr:4-alpha-glucanotransferase [Chloroflexota bacterium]
MSLRRASGVLVHPTSFPGPHGIGDLGDAAFRFVDWLTSANQRLWQILPLGPIGPGNSPYASPSAFAGNPLLISLPWLVGDGLLDQSDLANAPDFSEHDVDFGRVEAYKLPLLRRAYDRFRVGAASEQRSRLTAFAAEHAGWLDDYALFSALKASHQGAAWIDWERDLALRKPDALADASTGLHTEINFVKFVQFQFRRQWTELRRYANEGDVQIIGDIPIFVAYDSADVWAHPELFQLDANGQPTAMTGVPPDYFSRQGQLWGNPLYDWPALAKTGYRWWIDRVRASLSLVDMIRIDHFRAFAAAWSVPAGSATAAGGQWERGPGAAIFDAMRTALGALPFLVEDLGLITADVTALRDELGLPGMKVLQFAFDSGPASMYLPHTFDHHCVVYPATHDNQTTIGWFASISDDDRQSVQRYLGTDGSDIAWDLIRLALASTAGMAIVPLQDVMRLGDDARMNTPGQPTGNWGWRFLPHMLHPGLASALAELTWTYGRCDEATEARGYDPYDYTAPNPKHPLK